MGLGTPPQPTCWKASQQGPQRTCLSPTTSPVHRRRGESASLLLVWLNVEPDKTSHRNFTAFSHRFRMPGKESSGKGNFWYAPQLSRFTVRVTDHVSPFRYSFDYGLAHFVSFNTETDFYDSGEAMLPADPTKSSPGSSGPFGYINGSSKVNANYEQIQWMQNDLASVNRTKTPWIFAFGHRPMYSGSGSAMQQAQANAFEDLFLQYGVDLHLAG